uniref:Uncharacterized protein n=1 Tax=Trichobilharzia regenti TaxID=157069 RepID=A0AA85K569_TRIRE|nr:unnamed protein product [Trichobilharzia regenti]
MKLHYRWMIILTNLLIVNGILSIVSHGINQTLLCSECSLHFNKSSNHFNIGKKQKICPDVCDCNTSWSDINEKSICPESIPIIRDSCNCCWYCARQSGEMCSSRIKCDIDKDLFCYYHRHHYNHYHHFGNFEEMQNSHSEKSKLITEGQLTLIPESTNATGICWKNNGRPCFINGTWIPHSGVHGDGCPHQCTCIDGITLCHNLCSHIEAKRPPDELCNHIYNDGTTMRLQLMPPRQGECCKRWMCLRVPFSHPPGKGVYVNWKKESNYTEVKEIHGSHNQDKNYCNLVKQETSPWSVCSRQCGLGISWRWTTDNQYCQNTTDIRLCFWRPCEMNSSKKNNSGNRQFSPTLRFSRSGHLRFLMLNDSSRTSLSNAPICSQLSIPSCLQQQLKNYSTDNVTSTICQLIKPLKANFCNKSPPGHCCLPNRSKTKRLSFLCTTEKNESDKQHSQHEYKQQQQQYQEGRLSQVQFYLFEWIQSCICVPVTCEVLFNKQ